jgi:hypothetical protein
MVLSWRFEMRDGFSFSLGEEESRVGEGVGFCRVVEGIGDAETGTDTDVLVAVEGWIGSERVGGSRVVVVGLVEGLNGGSGESTAEP